MRPKTKRLIALVHVLIALIFAIGIGYDLLTSWNDIPNYIDSFSGVSKRLGWAWPVLPFAYFGLGVHFWINYDFRLVDHPVNLYILFGMHGVWTLVSWALHDWYTTTDETMLIWMACSAIAGMATYALFFPQRPPSLDEVYEP